VQETHEINVQKAQKGDAAALESLIAQIQGKVYRLALRMLWHPEDAKDATQEILLRVITHLSAFRGESSFSTWVYRIAANHLLTWRQSRVEAQHLSFEAFGDDLKDGLSDKTPGADDALLLQEIRVGCTLGMLLCLDRPHRLAYILGEILETDSKEAAKILGLSRANFRKRLERARAKITAFTQQHCGLANRENQCRCSRKVEKAFELKRIDPDRLLFAGDEQNARQFPRILDNIRRLEEMRRTVALFRSHPEYAVPDFTVAVRNLLRSSEKGMRLNRF
jgi:RNA polymerase sigma factor (sigma-70 family)